MDGTLYLKMPNNPYRLIFIILLHSFLSELAGTEIVFAHIYNFTEFHCLTYICCSQHANASCDVFSFCVPGTSVRF